MRAFLRRNQAQAMPEYTVVLAVVSSGSAFLLSQLGGRVTEVLMQVAGYLP
jgi:Flp pilus assembly pilin Flp